MIPVTLRDIFFSPQRGEAVLVLADETGRRGLPIFIGSWDSRMISAGLRKDNPRPFTFNFFASVLQAMGAKLTKVQVMDLVGNTFRALAFIRAGRSEQRVDARPSDAVALATVMRRPIYVTEALLAVAGKPLTPEGKPPGLHKSSLSTRWIWSNDSPHCNPR